MGGEPQTFWEHLEELRGSLIRMVVVVMVLGVVVFFFKEKLFGVILAPQSEDFITYRVLERLSELVRADGISGMDGLNVSLINTGLAHQFVLHVKASLFIGTLLALPYLLYLLFRFISPALYAHERKCAVRLVSSGYVMFMLGVLLSYFVVFPLTFRFLGTYQVSDAIENTVTVESYMDTLMMISLSMGVVFEIPVVCWILGRMGMLRAEVMQRYRKHVVVVLLIIAAIITPTSDAFTLCVVALPMWLLFELSILIVKKESRK